MGISKNYQEWLVERLRDTNEAEAYLNAALEESLKDDEESRELFLCAHANVTKAKLDSDTVYNILID